MSFTVRSIVTPPRLAMTVASACLFAAPVFADQAIDEVAIRQLIAGDLNVSAVTHGTTVLFAEQPGALEFSGELIVRPMLRPAVALRINGGAPDAAPLTAARARLAPQQVEYIAATDEYVVRVPAGQNENTYAAELLATGEYEYVHPNWICYPAAVPNDPQYGSQWHLPQIGADFAWDISTGEPSMIIAFVDSGVDVDHADLQARLTSGYNSVNRLAEIDGGLVSDVNGHGTAVAGSAAAITNNNVGVAGVAWDAALMPIRTSNNSDGTASLSNILNGAQWAVDHGASVVTISFTGVQSPSVNTTGQYVRDNGGLMCYAADNYNTDHSGWDHPAVIVVGATTASDTKASFSSYGRGVDVFAPGVSILTTTNGGGYGSASGTSFATPITAGAVSVIWSVDPNRPPQDVEQFLFNGCLDLGEPGDDEYWGHGRIDVNISAQLAVGTPLPPIANADWAGLLDETGAVIDVLANDYDLALRDVNIESVDATSALGGAVATTPDVNDPNLTVVTYERPAGVYGVDSFSYELGNGTGLTATGAVTVELIDPNAARDADSPLFTQKGLRAAYFDLSSPSALPDFDSLTEFKTNIVEQLDYTSTSGEFGSSERSDNFGAVFTGYVQVDQAATYTFYTESDDGSALYIGDQLIVNNDGLHGMQEASGSILLRPGYHELRVEFFEAGGGAGLIVSRSGAGDAKRVVAKNDLAYPSCNGDVNNDGMVDSTDLSRVLSSFGDCLEDPINDLPNFDRKADLNGDWCIDSTDLAILLGGFGATCE